MCFSADPIYFIASKILMIVQSGVAVAGIGLSAVFAYYFYKGMIGTYALHKIREEKRIQTMRKNIRNRNSNSEQKSYITGWSV